MIDTLTATDTTTVPPVLAFSPVTDTGLSILIEEHGSVWVHLINQRRIFDPRLNVEARLVADMCRARTDRMLALVTRSAA